MLLVTLSALLAWQVQRLLAVTAEVDRSTQVLASGNELYRRLVDEETGLRGYLLTGQSSFLEPYVQGRAQVGPELHGLGALITPGSSQEASLDVVRLDYEAWEHATSDVIEDRALGVGGPLLLEKMTARKARMERLRAQLEAFLETERRMRQSATTLAQRQARISLGIGVAFLALIGAGISFTSRRGLLSLSRSYRLAIEAERAAREAREDILATVSHDLRNPLSVIVLNNAAALRLTSPGEEGERARRRAMAVQRATERMGRLIDDLLAASSIDARGLVLHAEEHDGRALVTETIDLLTPIAEQRSIELAQQLPAEACLLSCDRDRVLRVLFNLVGNAIKFTPEGGMVTILVRPGRDQVTFTVTDTGPGIRAEQLPHLFERHWSGRGKLGADTGLGLYIAKGFVEAHGGSLVVDTVPGAGSSFSFSLPRGGSAAPKVASPDTNHRGTLRPVL